MAAAQHIEVEHAARVVASAKRSRKYVVLPIAARFWKKVDKNGTVPSHMPHLGQCWFWTAATDGRGYGAIRERQRGRLLKAHRVAWAIANGSIADDVLVLHRCDNRRCVRIEHLFLGSSQDNSRDAAEKGRLVYQQHPDRCPRGELHRAAKLTQSQVDEIRRLHESGISQTALSKQFGVTQAAIWYVVHRKTWRAI